jgi:hypothetical protein
MPEVQQVQLGAVQLPVPAGSLGVAAFGDSIMWGQGNKRDDRFSVIFTKQLKDRVGKPGVLVWDASRSGARIREAKGERQEFADIYPHLFPTAQARKEFLEGDDAPASRLYGEVPATFPTVLGQVKMIPKSLARQIDVALVDGGVNDIDVENVINPLLATGHYIERYDGEIRRVVEQDVTALLKAVRSKCPKAVIMYFGFFPGFSYASDTNKLREFFKHEYDDDFKWWLNRHVYEMIDVNKMINEAITRALWFNGRWQYWTRRAVNAMAANDADRGPGVIFVPSGFRADNAGFGPDGWLWDDYEIPIQDPAVDVRLSGIPRQKQLEQMVKTILFILPGFHDVSDRRRAVRDLDAVIDGPLRLKRDLQDFVAGQAGAPKLALDRLADEIHRIQHGMIASVAHPNKKGAASYAVQAGNRYQEHLKTMERVQAERAAEVSPPKPTLDATLRKYNLRGGPLDGDVTHLDVDSLAVIVKTATNSSRNMGLSAHLVLELKDKRTRRYLLTFKNHVDVLDAMVNGDDPIGKPYPYLEPDKTNRLTVVVDESLKLSDVVASAIVLGPDPWPNASPKVRSRYGRTWSPDSVQLEVNGRPVRTAELFGQKIGPGGHVDLGWPAPAPGFTPPEVVGPKLVQVKKLEAFAATGHVPATPAPRT